MSKKDTYSASILIVDDEPNNLKVLHNLLTNHGYDVRAARNGMAAIDAALATQPELILLDIKMPELDGYETCKRLKEDEKTRDIPIIFISALNNVVDIVEAFEVGGVDYITKPIQFEEVLARVKTHLTILYQSDQLRNQAYHIEKMRERDKRRHEQVSAMRDQFIQAATHDLKSPIGIVMGYADLLKRMDDVRSAPKVMDIVEHISDASDKMMTLVTDMMDILQLQTAYNLDLRQVNFSEFLQQHVEPHYVKAQEHNMDMRLSIPADPIHAWVDTSLMQRVVDNLVSNAIKYSPDNTPITISLRENDHGTVLTVQDEGYGMSAETIKKVFEPFYRGKKMVGDRYIEGTGLGLSIIAEIVHQHQGIVEVESELDKGSVFRVTIPKRETKEVMQRI